MPIVLACQYCLYCTEVSGYQHSLCGHTKMMIYCKGLSATWGIEESDLNELRCKDLIVPGYPCPLDVEVFIPLSRWDSRNVPIGLSLMPRNPKECMGWRMSFNGFRVNLWVQSLYCCIQTRKTIMHCLASVHSTSGD